ncbi:MAG: acetyl-CoA carboxylase carboxyltransferase subunit, partial [Frankiales bacterium]|nr:acetyl-CoA carboxylase carboxyltransferase subunit [Frankiales bacterium]
YDEDGDKAMRELVETQIEAQSLALANSGRVYDDGIIDPRDTRTVLGICLGVIHGTEFRGVKGGFGVFRM